MLGNSQKIPEEFLDRMRKLFPEEEEWERFLASLSEKPKRGLRLNLQKLKKAEKAGFSFEKWKEAWKLEPLFPEKEEMDFPKREEMDFSKREEMDFSENREYLVCEEESGCRAEIGRDPYHEGGLYYIQDPSAMEVVSGMHIRPFDRCLDLCAAPGGKSLHMADRLDGHRGGFLLSNEYVGERARILSQNAERMGYANLCVVNERPQNLAEKYPGFFSRILVDAPCSGEGMFRKSEEAIADWSPDLVEKCVLRQKEILKEAFLMLREGGELAYSTCTFEEAENEGIRRWILEENPDFQFMGEKRLYFHHAKGEGQYYAYFKKAGQDLEEKKQRMEYSILKKNKSIFLYPAFLSVFQDLKLFRLGIRIFEEGKNGWEYSHGLSHALNLEEILPIVEEQRLEKKYKLLYGIYLTREDKRIEDYLYGNEIPLAEEELKVLLPGKMAEKSGMGILYCDGIPLGFGYYRNGRLRNYYPKGLRYRK